METKNFYKNIADLALPLTLQALLQSSFTIADQLMVGRLGDTSIAAIGLAGKFISMYSVLLSAIATAAGIILSQYIGQNNNEGIRKAFHFNQTICLFIGLIFTLICLLASENIMNIYNKDTATVLYSSIYLRIFCISFLPTALATMASVILRCVNKALYPLYAGIASIFLNTFFNYALIFGNFGFPEMGVAGAAFASVLSQIFSCLISIFFLFKESKKLALNLKFDLSISREIRLTYFSIISPILICEFLWSLGENVYGAIYGNMGTKNLAAMTITFPIQGLVIGALSGLAAAAGIIIGKELGKENFDTAYKESKKLMLLGLYGSLVLSAILIISGRYYTSLYNVEPQVKRLSYLILIAFALIAPVKVQNMILGGGIIRSGGETKYVMWIDIIGTWLIGVPLGLICAFVLKLPLPYVYFILSLEEVLRLFLSIIIFKKRLWMKTVK